MLIVPKVGKIKIRQTQEVAEKTKSATFRREANGKWYVSLTVKFEMPDVPLPPVHPERVVGIDLGLKEIALKVRIGKLPLSAPFGVLFPAQLAANRIHL
ncbi:MAG: hypothetical protein IRY99_27975 [Isosphaeraceae bacterium]|nr:hypothetical protein [Isosphaeraceae bacterium]